LTASSRLACSSRARLDQGGADGFDFAVEVQRLGIERLQQLLAVGIVVGERIEAKTLALGADLRQPGLDRFSLAFQIDDDGLGLIDGAFCSAHR
jgi:uncharacterized protein YoaH (UPF0181 family)